MRGLRTFRARLGAIVGAALVLRLLYVLVVTRHQNDHVYDATWYAGQSLNLAEGRFFPAVFGPAGPDASHPPLVPILLAPVTWIFGLPDDFLPQRLVMVVVGAAVVLLVGLLGRAVAGPRVGLVAAAIAAVSPSFWMPSGIVMSEAPAMALTALLLVAAYRAVREPSVGNAALVGLACGLSLLVRAEAVLLVPMLVLPAVLGGRSRPIVERLRSGGVALVVIALVTGPWVVRNLVSFREPTFLATTMGSVVLGGACDETFYGPGTGGFSFTCQLSAYSGDVTDDQSESSARGLSAALRYVGDNLDRLPVVLPARVGRTWGVYRPLQGAEAEVLEGRPEWASVLGLAVHYVLLAAAAGGVIALRRRRLAQWPLLVPFAAVTLVALVGFGYPRHRATADVPLVVLAAVGLVFGYERLARRRRAA